MISLGNITLNFSVAFTQTNWQFTFDLHTNQSLSEIEPALLRIVKEGLSIGFKPQLISTGVNGAYYMYDRAGKVVAVFKPEDEEAGNMNNPKNFGDRIIKDGVRPSEGAIREVAAWMLDHGGVAGVPETRYASLEVEPGVFKVGSLQAFAVNHGCCEDLSSSKFSVDDVQRIAQLDIRLFNMDRSAENILYREGDDGSYQFIPIDHSYSLPHYLGKASFDWRYWKQADVEFSDSMKEYIHNIDINKDVEVLQQLGISNDSIDVMKLSTLFLKKVSADGWTLSQIASFIIKPNKGDDLRSGLEKLSEQAKEVEGPYWDNISQLLLEINLN